MPSKTQSIKNFMLSNGSPADLAALYDHDMEVQVLVDPGDGILVEGEFKGHKWQAYRDPESGQIYKSFRIPYEAKTTHPNYDDPPMRFDLSRHAQSVGMTGWNWYQQCSKWVGFDFDSITGHKEGLSDQELEEIKEAINGLSYCTIRKSTSGKGFHIYVFLDDVPTLSHTEHSALARSVLSRMCTDTGYDLRAKVDCFGGVLWVWDKRILENKEGLTLIKQGGILDEVPINWKDHVEVVQKKITKIRPGFIDEDNEDPFEHLIKERVRIPLDEIHRKVIDFLNNKTEAHVEWIPDQGILVTHTSALKKAHNHLGLRGQFETLAEGSEQGDKNCYCFPMKDGQWAVRRFSRGIKEETTWSVDSAGWTRCYLNRNPDLEIACKSEGGIEDTDGGFVFEEAMQAAQAAAHMGLHFDIPPKLERRESKILINPKTKRLIIKIKEETQDPNMKGWIRKQKFHTLVSNIEAPDLGECELIENTGEIRHCVTEDGVDAGWYIAGFEPGKWIFEPITHVRQVLSSMGHSMKERERQIGQLVVNYWVLTNSPFQPEYPGNRLWNKDSAQFKYDLVEEDELIYPTWWKILEHCGNGLNEAVLEDKWCKDNGITNGASYLKCWISAMFQEPTEPLPYLFFFGNEDCGKSILHEALTLLVTKGVGRIDTALKDTSNFNGELQGLILGVVEETNIGSRKNSATVSKIKDYVTSKQIMLHMKNKTPFMIRNTLHIMQCANDISNVPVFPGDTRVVVIKVGDLVDKIPKKQLLKQLEEEAAHFLTEVRQLVLPESPSRLRIPVVATKEKYALQESNITTLEQFMKDHVFKVPGSMVLLKDIWHEFQKSNPDDALTKFMFYRKMITDFGLLKGRRSNGDWCYGNISLDPEEHPGKELILIGEFLKEKI